MKSINSLVYLEVSECVLSTTNTKGRYEGKSFEDLMASIAEKGVLTPVLARELKKDSYEIVAGNRRFSAVKKLGIKLIPAMIVQMSDVEAREAQIVENLQREDIHPMDEGEAYRVLIEKSKYSLEDVAKKVGKSLSYVRDRLLLTNLIPFVVKEFREGSILASHASLIARLDQKKQKEAFHFAEDNSTAAELRDWIQKETFSDMKNAPWKNDEAMKAALAGCNECEGKGGDLFGKKAADVCSNPKCYAQKLAAYSAIKLKENPDMQKLSDYYGSDGGKKDVLSNSQYHAINSKKDQCDKMRKGIYVDGRVFGQIINFCNDSECEKHRTEISRSGYQLTPKEKAARKAENLKAEKEKAEQVKKINATLAKVKFPLSEKHLNVIVDLTFRRFGYSYIQPVASRHEIKAVKKVQNGYISRDIAGPVKKWLGEQDNTGKMKFIVEVILQGCGNDPKELAKF